MSESSTHDLFLKTMIMLTLMVVNINIANVLRMKGFHAISETSLYVLFGLVVGMIFVFTTSATHKDDIYNRDIQLSSSFFSLVLLPPIIFEGGFTLQRLTFIRNFATILGLALFGAVYSTVVISLLMYGFSRFLFPDFSIIHAMIFGSIISSTDPVSVLGMLPPSTDRNLYMLIFGESALNDAVAIILFRFFTGLVSEEDDQGNVSLAQFFQSIVESLWIFIGSSAIGITIALLFAKLTKHVKPPEAPIFELSMFLVFAYSSYLLAEILEFTGIISIFFCGVAMAHYAYDNMSKVTLLSSKVVLRTLSSMCDAFIFIYIGLGLFAFGKSQTTYNPGFIVCALISILISRTHVFIVCGVNNWYAKFRHNDRRFIKLSHQIFLWFCGLRGAVSFSLAVTILANTHIPTNVRALIFGSTMIVVFVTVVVMGGLTPFVMRKLGLGDENGSNEHEMKPITHADEDEGEHVSKSSKVGEEGKRGSKTTLDEYMPTSEENLNTNAVEFMDAFNNGLMVWIYDIDMRYIRPFFSSDNKRLKKQGNTYYETTATRISAQRTSGSQNQMAGDTYEIGNKNVVSALDDDDDDTHVNELDRVSIGQAAEMIGIRGSTMTLPSAKSGTRDGGFNSSVLGATSHSRNGSLSSLVRASRKNGIEVQAMGIGKAVMSSRDSSARPESAKLRGDAAIEEDSSNMHRKHMSQGSMSSAYKIQPPPSEKKANEADLDFSQLAEGMDSSSVQAVDSDDAPMRTA